MARKKVTSAPALADWGAVDNALRDIRECQHTLAEMAVQRDRQIDSIKADYAQGALPLQNRVKALEGEVKACGMRERFVRRSMTCAARPLPCTMRVIIPSG